MHIRYADLWALRHAAAKRKPPKHDHGLWSGRLSGKSKHPPVMVSSTYSEMVDHRRAIVDAILGQKLFPVAMENDAALPDQDLISASLVKVSESDGYVGLISYRYGQTPEDAERNPEKLSLTELEFRRACDREIPICMFIMHDDHLVPRSAVGGEGDLEREKLKTFIEAAKKNRIYAEFQSVDDLKGKAIQSLVKLREAIEARAATPITTRGAAQAGPEAADVPPGWEIIDRNALASIRAIPPSSRSMVQFFDGVLPTWRLVLAQGVQPRAVVDRLVNRCRAIHADATKPELVLVAGAGGEGKSTAVLHAAASLVEEAGQAWTCLHRQAANAPLPEDAFAQLPVRQDHAWVVVIDDADNIGPAIFAAVKKVATRTDIHVLLAARDAEWQLKRLVPGLWQPFADFHSEPLAGLDREDARRIVAGWIAWGDEAMGNLKGRGEEDTINALLGHARDLATRKEAGELLGALLITRQGEDMRAHVRTLINGLSRTPVIKTWSLRDIYLMVAAMHAENQLYLSRAVLAFALGCDVEELERKALLPLRREAMFDAGDAYVLTRHRRVAEAACAVMREDEEDVDSAYPRLARAALLDFTRNYSRDPDIQNWNTGLAKHFVEKGSRWWPVARAISKAIYDVSPNNGYLLTSYSSVLRDTGQAKEAFITLKATGDRFRNQRNVMYEFGAAAGQIHEYHLNAWLSARTLSDDGLPETRNYGLALSGLGVALRELFATSNDVIFAAGQAACGQLGLKLPDLDYTARKHLESHATDGRRHGIEELSPERAVDAISKAVIVATNDVEPDSDPVYFENLLGEPNSYRYTGLLQTITGTKPSPSRRQ